jgi:GT2 family glycosyltransferase
MSAVDLSVVIVSYNVRLFLDHCLQSVFRAARDLRVQVIVVDNASQDGSAEMADRRYPQACLIENRENMGFARANNQAFAVAKGEAVLILNPDAFIQENTLRVLLTRLSSSREVGAVGPMILLPDGRFEPRSMRGFPTPWAAFSYLSGLSRMFPHSPHFSKYLPAYLDPAQEHEVEALSGCCMMVRGDLLRQMGGFDADYFMYGEDLDLCWRLHRAGYRLRYTPATSIVHFKGESTRRSAIQAEEYQTRAMRLFVDKNLAGSISQPVRGALALGFGLHALGRKIGFLKRRGNSTAGVAEGTEGSLRDIPEFKDTTELKRRLLSGDIDRGIITTAETSYDQIIGLILDLRQRKVGFSLSPAEDTGEGAPKFMINLRSKSRQVTGAV